MCEPARAVLVISCRGSAPRYLHLFTLCCGVRWGCGVTQNWLGCGGLGGLCVCVSLSMLVSGILEGHVYRKDVRPTCV